MRPAMRALLVSTLVLSCMQLIAQPTVVGGITAQSGTAIPGHVGKYVTFIDFGRPVLSDGAIRNVSLLWGAERGGCAVEVWFKFFRPGPLGPNGVLTLVGVRGPYTPVPGAVEVGGINHFSFDAIDVKLGDLIAVTAGPPNPNFDGCKGVMIADSPIYGDRVYEIADHYYGGGVAPAVVHNNARLQVVASGSPLHFGGVIPVVGATKGNFGSFFKSTVTLTNDSGLPVSGRLVFHPHGVPASPSDPYVDFDLTSAFRTITYPDLVSLMNRTGLGSVDVYSKSFVPTITVRVFNDLGTQGTAGFSEELVRPREMFGRAAHPLNRAVIAVPVDLVNQRVNVGIRTLGSPVTIVSDIYSNAGQYLGSSPSKTYPADYFEQMTLQQFLAPTLEVGYTGHAGGMLLVRVIGGQAVLYTTTTDNRTNDSSMNMVTWQ